MLFLAIGGNVQGRCLINCVRGFLRYKGTIEVMTLFVHKTDESFKPDEHFTDIPFYQGLFFRRWQERYGREVISLVADDSKGKVYVYAQCVEYVLPAVGSVWVVARGPIGSFDSDSTEEAFYDELRSLCTEVSPKTSHVRFQKKPLSQKSRFARAELAKGVFTQPLVEHVISLAGEFQGIVDSFSVTAGRLVRRYTEESSEDIHFRTEDAGFKKHLDTIYTLLKESERSVLLENFSLRPYAYYEALCDELDAGAGGGFLVLGYVAGHEDPVTFVLTVYGGSEAHHLFSGSSSVGYEHNVPTLAFYTALKHAHERGMKRYVVGDTDSVLPKDLRILREEFGGEELVCRDLYDYIVSPLRYRLFRLLRLRLILLIRRFVMRLYMMIKAELTAED